MTSPGLISTSCLKSSRTLTAHLLTPRLRGQSGTAISTVTRRMSLGCHREDEFEVVMHPHPSTPKFHGTTYELSATHDCPPDHHNKRLPKLNFPSFDGDNTRLWISRPESYYEMYSIEPALWVKLSSLYFTDADARWIQSIESQPRQLEWSVFCKMLHDHFGRDQH